MSAAPSPAPAPTERPIHASLVRPVLFLGVERVVIALEATLCFALLVGVGLSLATLGLVAAVVLVIHPVMVWVTAKDAHATAIYVRSLGGRDYYAPHPELGASRLPVRPSIPKAQ